jgi:hypothetical protein
MMSWNMSSESSIPQLNRTRLSLMPSFALSSGVWSLLQTYTWHHYCRRVHVCTEVVPPK